MAGNEVLHTVWHTVSLPGAQTKTAGQRKPRAAAEAHVMSALRYEAANGFDALRAKPFGFASGRATGHEQHLACQAGMRYV